MYRTTKDAAACWCPFAKARSIYYQVQSVAPNDLASHPGEVLFIRTGSVAPDSMCLHTQCMSWQWGDKTLAFGYCGLAGVPAVPFVKA